MAGSLLEYPFILTVLCPASEIWKLSGKIMYHYSPVFHNKYLNAGVFVFRSPGVTLRGEDFEEAS